MFNKSNNLSFVEGDVTDIEQVKKCFLEYGKIDVVLNLAAQVAVTTSVINPREDFKINALGTFNICEAVRQFQPEAILLNSSTNKVYGEMDELGIVEEKERYMYSDLEYGISEKNDILPNSFFLFWMRHRWRFQKKSHIKNSPAIFEVL